MQWKIEGAHHQTGEDTTIVVEADTEQEAVSKARGTGVLASSVKRFGHRPAPAPPTHRALPEWGWAAIVGGPILAVIAASVVIFQVVEVRPLQQKVHSLTTEVEALARTVNHNADAANHATQVIADDLDSLTRVVNNNAETANFNNRLR
jgi:hypothetical protein